MATFMPKISCQNTIHVWVVFLLVKEFFFGGGMFLKYIRQGYNGVLNTTFDLSQKAEKRYNGVLNKRHVVKTAV